MRRAHDQIGGAVPKAKTAKKPDDAPIRVRCRLRNVEFRAPWDPDVVRLCGDVFDVPPTYETTGQDGKPELRKTLDMFGAYLELVE